MQTFFDSYRFAVPAGGTYRLNNYSSFITLLSNDSLTAVRVGIDGFAAARMLTGLSIELPQGEKFRYLEFRNESAAIMNIEVALSSGRIYDSRLVLSGVVNVTDTANQVETPAAIAVPNANANPPTNAVNLAADADNKQVILQNNGLFDVWAGDATVNPATNRGSKIEPGDSLILPTSAQIFFVGNGGASTISVNKLQRV